MLTSKPLILRKKIHAKYCTNQHSLIIFFSRAVVPFSEQRGFWVSRSAYCNQPPYHRAARRGGKDGVCRATEREKSPTDTCLTRFKIYEAPTVEQCVW